MNSLLMIWMLGIVLAASAQTIGSGAIAADGGIGGNDAGAIRPTSTPTPAQQQQERGRCFPITWQTVARTGQQFGNATFGAILSARSVARKPMILRCFVDERVGARGKGLG